jgi:hypothetical protein
MSLRASGEHAQHPDPSSTKHHAPCMFHRAYQTPLHTTRIAQLAAHRDRAFSNTD